MICLPSATQPKIFPRRLESRNVFFKKRCIRLRGHDAKNSLNLEFNHKSEKIAIDKRQYERGNPKGVGSVVD